MGFASFSDHWHRVAPLRPRLAAQVQVQRQRARGSPWWVLADSVSGRSCRLNAAAYALAGRLDGRHSVQALWQALQDQPGEAPTQDEVIELLARLREQGLLDTGTAADFAGLLPQLRQGALAPAKPSLLAWRLPLGNPSRLLRALPGLQRALFSRTAALLWLLAMAWLLLAGLMHASELWRYGERWATTPRFALLALLLYLPVKAVHELAHGLALRSLGGEVRQAGITLMLGLPVPFVDASGANALPLARQRMRVAGAGIATELALAALALAAWLLLAAWGQDGVARELAFVVFSIASVSTLVFNANPLQRLDGYYLLCDALQLPNLAPRSREHWLHLLRRHALRVPEAPELALAPGEAKWLLLYAPLSWLVSLGVAVAALAWLGSLAAWLAALAAPLLAWQLLLQPAWRWWQQLRAQTAGLAAPARRLRRAGLALAGLLLACLAVPVPRHTLAMGVVWPPDEAQLRADSPGFVQQLLVADGQAVQAGDAVLQLDNPALQAQQARQAARVAALESELIAASAGAEADGERGANRRAELQAAQAELARTQEKLAGLTLRAGVAGRVAWPQAADLPGQWVPQGRLLGQLLTGAATTVRVALPEDEAPSPQAQSRRASVRLAAAGAPAQAATLLRDSLAAQQRLPSAALSQAAGGPVLTDPDDREHLRSLRPVVLLDLQLAPAAAGATTGAPRLGQRAWVRFDEGWSPLAWQWAAQLQRLWLRQANPQR